MAKPRQNPRAADPSMLSPSGRPLGKFLGYFKPGVDDSKIIGGILLRGNSMQNVMASTSSYDAMFYFDSSFKEWMQARFRYLWIGNVSEIRLTNDFARLRGFTRLLIKERKRVAVYEVR